MWSVPMVLIVVPALDRVGDLDDKPEGEQRERADNEAGHVRPRERGAARARGGLRSC